ncbi:MAG: DNA repair exonuclease, partial [Corynebacterium matruchotii]
MTTRFLHTSDLQLGMTRWFLQETEDAQALFDAARVEAITRLGEKAIEYQ